ncbi:MAG: GIY-YIG nuclease family protein [Patescibacteria group bacterium]
MHYTYILSCTDNFDKNCFYVGYTADLNERVRKHRSGATQTTRRFKSIKLVYYEACLSETDARRRELELKTGFGRGYAKRRLRDYLSKRV